MSSAADRLPPGQEEVDSLPVLHVGDVPTFDPASWQLALGGAVQERRVLGWRAFRSLPAIEEVGDMHCVTGWSRLGLRWRGVRLADLIELAGADPRATSCALGDGRGYEISVPLDVATQPTSVLAFELDGEPLTAAHGGPLRAVIPSRYAWKSVKWVRSIELLTEARPGYWDRRGYLAGADPSVEERMA